MFAIKLKDLILRSPLLLSPMAGYTNLPFRLCVRSLGGLSIATTDLVSARSLLEMNPKGIRMVASCSNDRPLGVQLFGGKSDELRDAARFLEDLGIDLIDINMGCPVEKVTKQGGGAALMKDEELTEELVRNVVDAVDLPVTVKMRLGWDDDNINAHKIAPRLEQMGVAAVAIHGRTREQGYTGSVNLDGIRAVVESVKKIPVFGNGDVSTHHDAKRMIDEIGCAGVMVGRAALADPFFFRKTLHFLETAEVHPEITLEERMLFMHRHFATAVWFYGEHEACVLFRKVVPGYSEYFPSKETWRRETQEMSCVDDYKKITKKLCPSDLSELCREPDLDVVRNIDLFSR
ncbi:MAG: tRNA dihydrouridine synthase DusB [Verrucomicrobiota bacterium]